jgi:Na+-translocating ferredoxin:NAD+ oxidoreductase RNF subunit RnfB
MTGDIYRDLQKYLETLSFGFPATESGIEIKILKKIFSEEEVKMYLNMKEVPETPQEVAERIKKNPKEVADFLAQMASDGLLFRFVDGAEVRYAVCPFMIGLFENNVPIGDKELKELMEKYCAEKFTEHVGKMLQKATSFRVVPVGMSIDTLQKVSTYDINREYLKSQESIAVIDCACRTKKVGSGKECNSPREVCMAFGWYADYLVQNKLGRAVSREEALEIQNQCEEAGLISLRGNLKEGGITLCHCCKCCCIGLQGGKKLPRPADAFVSNFYASVNSDLCTGCETCVDRCQMEAIRIEDDVAVIDRDRCIGCGVCVPACPVDALGLVQKGKKEEPMDLVELLTKINQAREECVQSR